MAWHRSHQEHAAASILAIGILVGAAWLVAILAAVGGSHVAHAELQQAADIAAATVEHAPGDAPRERAVALARANGADLVTVTEADGGARLRILVRAAAPRDFGMGRGAMLEAEALATLAIISTDVGPDPPGVYRGPLETVDGVQVCPAVAAAYRRMDSAAASDGVVLAATSGFRGWAEQAALYARLGPGLAAPPGASRHHDATELDLNVGPAGSATHRWLSARAAQFGFVQRYSWEPWHWGNVRGC